MLPACIAAEMLTEQNELMQTYTSDKRYNYVCWLTSHNSYAYNEKSFENKFINENQSLNIRKQLEYGVRGFMIDLYYEKDNPANSIILAHSMKEKGNSFVTIRHYKQKISSPFLETVKKWLDDNPQDIITFHLESYIRDYNKIIEELKTVGLYDYLFDLYEYNNQGLAEHFKSLDSKELAWPTLGEMRQHNKQLVVFSDKIEDSGYGIMYVSNTMETQYDLDGFPSCEKRYDGRVEEAPIFIFNHFCKYRSMPASGIICNYKKRNKYDNILLRVAKCWLQECKSPNFVAVDMVGHKKGNEKQIVLDINNYNEKCYKGMRDINLDQEEIIIENGFNSMSESTPAPNKRPYRDEL